MEFRDGGICHKWPSCQREVFTFTDNGLDIIPHATIQLRLTEIRDQTRLVPFPERLFCDFPCVCMSFVVILNRFYTFRRENGGMRTWEFDDTRAAPSNLVLEQDFILRIRRLHRLGSPHLVANIMLSAIPSDYSGRGTTEEAQRRIQAIALAQKGTYAEMTNGDVFVMWPISSLSKVFPEQLLMVTLPNGVSPGDLDKFVRTYTLPEDYPMLRERANYYISEQRDTPTKEDDNSPSKLLQSEAARGVLSAWSVSLVEKLVKEIDLCHFIRSQTIYEYQPDKSWKQWFDETFIGLDEVKQKYFPHIDVNQPKHLFLELCQVLDRGLLEALTLNYSSVSDMSLSLNLSLHTVLGMEFAQFTHRIPKASRSRIGFEVHCGDLLQDFTQTLNAIATFKQEGYKISIDGITPDMLGYFNFAKFDVDYFKINVSKDYATSLKFPAIREGIAQAPKDKLVFFHCDNEQSLAAGIDLGVTKFQGWLVDDKARVWRK